MVKEELPQDERERLEPLCSSIFERRTGVKGLRIVITDSEKVSPLSTKSKVYRARLEAHSGGSVNGVPNIVGIKKYFAHRGTSDNPKASKDEIARQTYRTEKAVLGIGEEKLGGRVYPKLYGFDDETMTLVREYLEGITLDQIAREGAQWTSDSGPSLCDFLDTLVTLHLGADVIANELKERDLLKYGTPDEVDPAEHIALDRAEKSTRHLEVLVNGLGKKLDPTKRQLFKEYRYELEKQLVSAEEFLTMIDAELGALPHHAMLKMIPDAGGVEVGGIPIDLSVYSAPVFMQLCWKGPEDMVNTIIPAYIRKIEERRNTKAPEIFSRLLPLSTLDASFTTNLAVAAAIVYHMKSDVNHILGQDVTTFLNNAFKFADSVTTNGQSDGNIISCEHQAWDIADQYGLYGKTYEYCPIKESNSGEFGPREIADQTSNNPAKISRREAILRGFGGFGIYGLAEIIRRRK